MLCSYCFNRGVTYKKSFAGTEVNPCKKCDSASHSKQEFEAWKKRFYKKHFKQEAS
ncbi:hypothetical protein [Guptibacillus hwajinpoensis]|uniref:hypothetical protein n=1 Tax=Guptibacillus hwajinpoensis TaxID=208199 RepID=UPI0013792086|nr:hypothetical protein [Alkalihalobacillus macyae]